MAAEPIQKTYCPKCGKTDVLVGNKDEPNHCTHCDHEWEYEPAAVISAESTFRIKSPEVLMTINQNLRRRTSKFEQMLTEALNVLFEETEEGSERVELDPELNPDWRDEEAYKAAGLPASFPATVFYEAVYFPGETQTRESPGEVEGYDVTVTRIVMDDGRDILEMYRKDNSTDNKIPGAEDSLPDTDVFEAYPYGAYLKKFIDHFSAKMADKLMAATNE